MFSLVSLTAQEKTNIDTLVKQEIPPNSIMGQLANRNWFEFNLQHLWTNTNYCIEFTDRKRIITQFSDSMTIVRQVEYDYYLSDKKVKKFNPSLIGKNSNGKYIVFKDTTNGYEVTKNIEIQALDGSMLRLENEYNKQQILTCTIEYKQEMEQDSTCTTMDLLCHKEWENIENGNVWYFEEDVLTAYWDGFRKKRYENYYLTDKPERYYNRSKTNTNRNGKYIHVRTYHVWLDNGTLYKGEIEFSHILRIVHLSENKLILRTVKDPDSGIKEYELEFKCN